MIGLDIVLGLLLGFAAAYFVNKNVRVTGGIPAVIVMLLAFFGSMAAMIYACVIESHLLLGASTFSITFFFAWGRFRELDIICGDDAYKPDGTDASKNS